MDGKENELTKTPITQKQWMKLRPKDRIKDKNRHIWKVKWRELLNPDCIVFRRPILDGWNEKLRWKNGIIRDADGGAYIEELHHPSVKIIR